jgi:hypothetical protein
MEEEEIVCPASLGSLVSQRMGFLTTSTAKGKGKLSTKNQNMLSFRLSLSMSLIKNHIL